MKKHTIIITENQIYNIRHKLNEGSYRFSVDYLKNNKWNNGTEVLNYCYNSGLLEIGRGGSRTTFRIDDEKVIKVERDEPYQQNAREVEVWNECDNIEKNFVAQIYDFDTQNENPIWLIAEQVLPATYSDFYKLAGIDYGYYPSRNEINQFNQELRDYQKYDGKIVTDKSVTLDMFLEAYDNCEVNDYKFLIEKNNWIKELYYVLEKGLANPWELQIIDNWGLVKRNGKPKLVILDFGI